MLSPNGGEKWEIDKTYNITWKSTGEIDDVIIALYPFPQGKASFSKTVPNTGVYSYLIPRNERITEFKIFVTSSSDTSVTDESDLPFNIVSTDETAAWQTYRNEEYEFEFRYPREWHLKTHEVFGIFLSPNEILIPEFMGGGFLTPIHIYNLTRRQAGIVLRSYTEENYFKNLESQNLTLGEDHEISVKKVSGISWSSGDDYNFGNYLSLAFVYPDDSIDRVVRFGYSSRNGEEPDANLDIFNQILSTFRFLD